MPIQSAGRPVMHESAASGFTSRAAATVSVAVTDAIRISGTAKRIVRASASTSAVVRETRSPVPARSTVESGSASTRRMKSSRSSPKICSERTKDARRANQVRIVCTSRNAASAATSLSTWLRVVPSCTDCTSAPSSAGPARPAAAAAPLQTDHHGEAATVAPAEPPGLRAQLRALGDGQELVHSSAPRVTISR